MIVLNCLPGLSEHVKATGEDFVEVLVCGHDGRVDDGLEVLLDLVELVLVLAVPVRQTTVVQEGKNAANAGVDRSDGSLAQVLILV